jgi:hypothetical protein
MYAGANMGHPSREEGFVLRSDFSAAEVLHPAKLNFLSIFCGSTESL